MPFAAARLAVNTQTPPVRFVDGEPRDTTGGVVRMLAPLLHRWKASGRLRAAQWVALGGDGEERHLRHGGLDLAFVALPDEDRRGYAQVKERMWTLLNANPEAGALEGDDGLAGDDWVGFDAYQVRSAAALEEAAARMGGVDALYVHDFQQLGVASSWRGPRVPKLFHLHTPFPSVLPPGWRDRILTQMRRYDAVVVSTRRYAENLRAAGLDRPIHVIHPFIDPAAYLPPSPGDLRRFRERFGLAPDDRVVLSVARMDPMKGQDRLVRSLPSLLAREPRTRLLLVGNGSFSSSRRGGLGLDKGRGWRAHLEGLAAELGVEERVTFTGHLADEDLPAAYGVADVFALPSTREGFGLAVIEAWLHGVPVVVCERAGVSELVEHGVNGLAVDAATEELGEALLALLRAPDAAREMGRAGRVSSRAATLEVGASAIERVLGQLLEEPPHAVV